MFDNINIVLVNTSHPGNIGSSARAMGVMGFNKLSLVQPKEFPSEIATAMAVGCDEILKNAIVYQDLSGALSESAFNIGFSARPRKESIPTLSVDECIKKVSTDSAVTFNIIFGNEKNGLSNEELLMCDYIVTLPTASFYSSLNLSAAVQIFTYELLKKSLDNSISNSISQTNISPAKTKDKEAFYKKLIALLVNTEFITEKNSKSLTKKIHIMFNKAMLEEHEISILRGILSSIENKINS